MDPSQASKRIREQPGEDAIDSIPPPVDEGESDDEYQDIATSRVPKPPTHISQGEVDTKTIHASSETQTDDTDMQEPVAREIAKVHADATDDDWLRSRTSRVLDLLDPDEAPLVTVSSEAPGVDRPRDVNSRDVKPSDETREDPVSELDESGDKHDTGNPLDLIKKTSRIFVRNLSYTVKENDLQKFFGSFGSVEEVRNPDVLFPNLPLLLPDVMNP